MRETVCEGEVVVDALAQALGEARAEMDRTLAVVLGVLERLGQELALLLGGSERLRMEEGEREAVALVDSEVTEVEETEAEGVGEGQPEGVLVVDRVCDAQGLALREAREALGMEEGEREAVAKLDSEAREVEEIDAEGVGEGQPEGVLVVDRVCDAQGLALREAREALGREEGEEEKLIWEMLGWGDLVADRVCDEQGLAL